MSIEKPISTIRKAVEGAAQDDASKEFLDKPEARHYEAVFERFKFIRDSSPRMLENVIKLAAGAKDLHEKIDPEAYKVFQKVSNELNVDLQAKLMQAVVTTANREDINEDNIKEELFKLFKRASDEAYRKIITDPRVEEVFKGKEESLVDLGLYLEGTIQPTSDLIAEQMFPFS